MMNVNLGNLVGHLKLDDSLFKSTLRRTEQLLVNSAKNLARAGTRYAKMGAVAVTGYLAASAKAFASFEEQMQFVSTMLDEQTMKYLPEYSKAVKQMAVDFGESTATISKGLYDILSASVAPDKALNVLQASMTAAKAGMTDTAVAADAITTILNSYSLSADEAGNVSDLLFAIVKRGKTTFNELAPQIGMVASVAATAGVKLEDVGAVLATMTRAGLSTDIAVTSLRQAISSFIDPTDEAKEAARELGLELSATSLRSMGLVEMLSHLKKASTEQLAALIPNIRAYTGVAATIQQMSGALEDLTFMYNRAGLTQEAYNKMTQTLSHTLSRLWQAIKIISVDVGSRLAGDIERVSEMIISNRESITRWAQIATEKIRMVLDAFVSMLKVLKTRFNQEFQNFLMIGYYIFEATAKMIINLAFRTGAGMIKAIKAGILGDDLGAEELKKRALALYKEMDGEVEKISKTHQKPIMIPGVSAGAFTPMQTVTVTEEIALDTEKYDKAVEEVLKKHEGRFVDSVFKGYTDDVKDIMDDMIENMTSPEMGDIGKVLSDSFAEMKERMTEMNSELDTFQKYGHAAFETIDYAWNAVYKLNEGLNDSLPPLKKASDDMKEMLDRIDAEIESTGLLNQGFEHAQEYISFRNAALFEGNRYYAAMTDEAEKQLLVQTYVNEQMEVFTDKIKELEKLQKGGSFKRWLDDAQDLATNLENNVVGAFETVTDALTNMIEKGSMNWKEFTSMILHEFLRTIVKMQLAAAAAELSPLKDLAKNFITNLFNTAATDAATGGGAYGDTGGGGPTGGGSRSMIDYQGAKGLLFNLGKIIPMARGSILNSIISKPILAPMANNQTALMGEAGEEAVVPLTRTSGGELGVKSLNPRIENKLKIINVRTHEELIAAMQSDEGEKVILNTGKKNGVF